MSPDVFNSLHNAKVACIFFPAPLTQAWLTKNEVFFVHTNGGNREKVQITAASTNPATSPSSNSLTLSFVTYSDSGSIASGNATRSVSAGDVPTISAVLSNYSKTLPGAPNYGISPESLVAIYGSNLAANSADRLQTGTRERKPPR